MTSTTTSPRSWSQVVRLHADVERGDTSVASYAIDLGALVSGDSNIPRVYREAGPFFAATYLTKGLRDLLAEVLGRLAGESGDRVLQLHSPFGGGKSHTLAALYHATLHPEALRQLPEASSLPNPGPVRVAVFDGEKFDVQGGVVNGQRVLTLWGALAAWLGRYDAVAYHDEGRIAPGGDKIAEMLGDQPTLLLLDEVLKYLVSGRAAVMNLPVGQSTLGEQTQNFLQTLSTEVARSPHAVLVYSLQASAREALGNEALLNVLDHLVSRVDAKREPVRGDEVLSVLQRRLLAEPPPQEIAAAVAGEFATQITKMRTSRAASLQERRNAEDERFTPAERLQRAYPFHPALIDLMWERWSALPEF
jgi:predicted AAA+ superfamily ATPase